MKKSVWVLLVIVTLLLSACGPAMKPATGAETESGELFMIALPRIVVDFDASGNPSILGIKMADIENALGVSLGLPKLDEFFMKWAMTTNVQHIELRQTGNGMALFVNSKPMPHIAWSDASLQKASEVGMLLSSGRQGDTSLLRRLMPIIRRVGLDIVLRFPRNAGVTEIALTNPDDALKLTATPSKADEVASAIVQMEIRYDENGVPGIMGISAADLAAMGIRARLKLDDAYIKMLQANNIQSMELRGKADGLYIFINNDPLPNLVWDDTYLGNAADLYAQMNPASPYVDLAKQIVPLVNNADIAILMHFPLNAGQTPIAVKMH